MEGEQEKQETQPEHQSEHARRPAIDEEIEIGI